MTTTPTPLSSEAEFIAAEREIARLRQERLLRSDGSDEANQLYFDRIDCHFDSIASSPPLSLPSAAVKLRLLTHPDLGIEEMGASAQDLESLKQVASFLSLPRRSEVGASDVAEDDALANARNELEDALAEMIGLAEVIQNIGHTDLAETFPYLASQLRVHRDQAHDAFARLFGLNKHSAQQGGPGPLVIRAPVVSAERAGGAA
jgi:hypothetical protein